MLFLPILNRSHHENIHLFTIFLLKVNRLSLMLIVYSVKRNVLGKGLHTHYYHKYQFTNIIHPIQVVCSSNNAECVFRFLLLFAMMVYSEKEIQLNMKF